MAQPGAQAGLPQKRGSPLAQRWAKSMRTLFILATLIPFIVYASGEESSTYYAVFDSNKVVVIEFSGESIFKEYRSIYRNKKVKAFNYCWPEDDGEHFYCSQTKNKIQAVVYRKGPDTGDKYRKAMKVLKQNIKISKTGGMFAYYVCDKGCSSNSPMFIFEVIDSGC